jgi:hypothetical protein
MAFHWTAKTLNRDFHSQRDAFKIIPQEHLLEFSLLALEQSLRVNLASGELSVNGNPASLPELASAFMRQSSVSLHYYQRGFTDMDPNSLKRAAGVEYAVCGWEGDKNRAYWRIDGATGKINLHIEEV